MEHDFDHPDHQSVWGEYNNAVRFLDALDHMRHGWHKLQPAPPLRKGDFALLMVLHNAGARKLGDVTVGQLAAWMRQSPPGISQKLSSLEQTGLVRRVADPSDRRLVRVELTTKGALIVENEKHSMLGRTQHALETLGDENTQVLIDLLNRLGNALEEELNHQPPAEEKNGPSNPPSAKNGNAKKDSPHPHHKEDTNPC